MDSSKAGSITVTETQTVDAAPDEVWSTIRDFDAISLWHPAVESSDITEGENNKPGAKRHLTLTDGGTIDEQLITWDDQGMRYSYKILDGVLPVANYRSTIAVEAEGNEQSKVIWKGRFDPAEGQTADKAREVMKTVYRAGLDNIKTMMDGND
ncbi:SRPBCC family protein [Salinisphaera sp. T31B1]|uniref:SRPBCC family protein n=1 Tax=Salinisphaera sp. T31B1 TaxID=727963 RepID=UPI0033404232